MNPLSLWERASDKVKSKSLVLRIRPYHDPCMHLSKHVKVTLLDSHNSPEHVLLNEITPPAKK